MHRFLFVVCLFMGALSMWGNEKPIIRIIEFRGNQMFGYSELLAVMVLKPKSIFSETQLSHDLQSICNLYHRYGYYFVQILADSKLNTPDSSSIEVMLTLNEGPQVNIGNINFSGNNTLTAAEILQMFDTKPGDFLLTDVLESDIDRLLSHYEKIGFPFANVKVQNISTYQDGSSLKLKVDLLIEEGKKITISEIRIIGNSATKEHVILREARIKLQEIFNQANISKIRNRLTRLNIFSQVQEPELYITSAGGGLLIKVQEGNTNTFDGILGYTPGKTSAEAGDVIGQVNISMRNLFATARKFNVRWQRDGKNTQELYLHYTEPWIFNFPINISGNLKQRFQDMSYVLRAYELKTEFLLTESFNVNGIFNLENIIPGQAVQISKSTTMLTGIEIQYDTRDNIISPTSGFNYHSGYRFGSKKLFGDATKNGETKHTVQKLSIRLEFFMEIFSHQILMVGLHGRSLSSRNIEIGDLYRFGGTNTLRGYRENQLVGSRIAWTNTEYRFLFAQQSFLYGFFDTGYFYLPEENVHGITSKQDFKFGYGAGVRTATAIGNLGVSLAFGKGDSFLQGKIHLNLIGEW